MNFAEITNVAFNFAPRGAVQCEGQLLPINGNTQLFSLLGTTYGGDGRTTFALPRMRGRTAVSASDRLIQGTAEGSELIKASNAPSAGNMQPFETLNAIICVDESYTHDVTPYIGATCRRDTICDILSTLVYLCTHPLNNA